ncbi:MAG: helix-turn-helix domain-containing protein [Haloarculaceae archaeon]
MDQVTFLLEPERGYFDEGELALRAAGVRLRQLHQLQVLADDTVIGLYEVDADPAAARACLDAGGEKVRDYSLLRTTDGQQLWLHYRPSELLREVFAVYRERPVSWQFPLEHCYEGETMVIRDSMAGPKAELSDLVAAYRAIDGLAVHVERVDRYDPTVGRLYGALSERQREVFRAAYRRGYYRVPRGVTHEELAAELECSASAVGRILRRVEAAFADAVAPEADLADAPDPELNA